MSHPADNIQLKLTNLEMASAFDAVGAMIRKRPAEERSRINNAELKATYGRILRARGVDEERAQQLEGCAIQFSLQIVDMKKIEEELQEITMGLDKIDDPLKAVAVLQARLKMRNEEIAQMVGGSRRD